MSVELLPHACAAAHADSPIPSSDPSRVWLPELVRHIASFLSPNEVACTLRLVDKATAAQFSLPEHKCTRLSAPSPQHAFTHRWCSPGGLRSFTLSQKRELLHFAARSGSIANLEALMVLLPCGDRYRDHELFEAAAAAGQQTVCAYLRDRGFACSPTAVTAAASADQDTMCFWLLDQALCLWDDTFPAAAARAGHKHLAELLMGRPERPVAGANTTMLLEGAAEGCSLADLQGLTCAWGPCSGIRDAPRLLSRLVTAAVASPTEWQAKVVWLEEQGASRHLANICCRGVSRPDARERLQWLHRERGFSFSAEVVRRAAALCGSGGGCAGALEFLLSEEVGFWVNRGLARSLVLSAAEGGNLHALRVLHARGCSVGGERLLADAAGGNSVELLEWMVEALGLPMGWPQEEVGVEAMAAAAARAGSQAVLSWLVERGCGWSAACFTAAVCAGASEEQLEWMVERGCPMPTDGQPWAQAAANSDLSTLHCLKRLGCPDRSAGAGPRGIQSSVRDASEVSVLCCLLERGVSTDRLVAKDAGGAARAGIDRVTTASTGGDAGGQQQAVACITAQRQGFDGSAVT